VQLAELCQERIELETPVRGRVGTEPPDRLRELSLRAHPASAPCLVPRDRDVHESLEEVALLRRRGPPGLLELLVRGEVLARADQLDASTKA
jgi:hypothetical protein